MGGINNLTACRKDGRIIPVEIALNPITTPDGNRLVAVSIRDATAQRDFVNRLEQLATTDPLTGALNRRSFENAYRREVERGRRAQGRLYLMIVDIDHFKKINDTYGHAVGDVALKALVSTCLATLRKTDVFARIGGEEFAILTPAKDAKEAMQLAERIRVNVAQMSIPAEPAPFAFTVSIGICQVHWDDSRGASLGHADGALYRAKDAGRNRVAV
jgi:diguanylate cyclase (GGDEF)-like protein